MPTVHVEPVGPYNAVLMAWEAEVHQGDITRAFRQILAHLEASSEPIFVVVDIRHNHHMPLLPTVQGALSGAYQHPHLKAWLVVGRHPLARQVENALAKLTQRHNVVWFDDYDAALNYLIEQGRPTK